jgi:hypothetical protein
MPCTLWTDITLESTAVKMVKMTIDEQRLKLVDKISQARK